MPPLDYLTVFKPAVIPQITCPASLLLPVHCCLPRDQPRDLQRVPAESGGFRDGLHLTLTQSELRYQASQAGSYELSPAASARSHHHRTVWSLNRLMSGLTKKATHNRRQSTGFAKAESWKVVMSQSGGCSQRVWQEGSHGLCSGFRTGTALRSQVCRLTVVVVPCKSFSVV